MPAVRVYGDPVPKGSMECLGPRGKGGRHLVVDSKRKVLDPWEAKVAAAGRAMLAKVGAPLSGALTVSVTFTLERPKSVPLAQRPYPITRASGDVDKLLRAVLDGLTASGIYADDARVIHAEPWKSYPDSPGIPDRMDRPGAHIRIEAIT